MESKDHGKTSEEWLMFLFEDEEDLFLAREEFRANVPNATSKQIERFVRPLFPMCGFSVFNWEELRRLWEETCYSPLERIAKE